MENKRFCISKLLFTCLCCVAEGELQDSYRLGKFSEGRVLSGPPSQPTRPWTHICYRWNCHHKKKAWKPAGSTGPGPVGFWRVPIIPVWLSDTALGTNAIAAMKRRFTLHVRKFVWVVRVVIWIWILVSLSLIRLLRWAHWISSWHWPAACVQLH